MGSRGFSLIELLTVIIILGILLLITVPRLTRLFSKEPDVQYCSILQTIRQQLEVSKEQDIVHRCYPDDLIIDTLKDPYTGNNIIIASQTLSSIDGICSSPSQTDKIYYCPIVVNGCAYAHKLGISSSIKSKLNSGCLLGVDNQ